jgi:thioesterase domain-containing protein
VVHGLARTRVSFALMARDLHRAGHRVSATGYAAAVERFDAVCARVRTRIGQLAAGGEAYALVGHSLGGLILRIALATDPPLGAPPRRLLMIGTPNRMPRRAVRIRRLWPYQVLTGEAGRRLADAAFFDSLPPVSVPYTIIAGTAGRRGARGPFEHQLNDGTVAVEETLVSAADVPILLPVRHTFMLMNRGVRAKVVELLAAAEGRS